MLKVSKLKNGMRVITDTDKNCDTVSLGVFVQIGSRYESVDISGISHVLEHMAFKGTKKRTAYQISAEAEDVGGILNAYTGLDMTCYYIKVLKENLALGLDIIADIVQNSQMPADELAKEKGVICQEINMYKDEPSDLAYEHFMETAFPNQALGRPVIGSAEVVKAITSEQLLDYMHTNYVASRMILSVAGNFDAKELLSMAEDAFGGVSDRKTLIAEAGVYAGGSKIVTKKTEQVNVFLGFKGVSYTDPDYYPVLLLSGVLAGGMSSRLFQEIREKRGLVYSIDAANLAQTDTGVFEFDAGTGEKEVSELVPVLCDEILRLKGTITDEELQRAKNQIKAQLLMRDEICANRMGTNAKSLIYQGRIVPKEEKVAQIDAVTPADLDRVGSRIFAGKPTFTALGPVQHVMTYEDVCARLGIKG